MKHAVRGFVAIAIGALVSSQAHAAIYALWDFDGKTAGDNLNTVAYANNGTSYQANFLDQTCFATSPSPDSYLTATKATGGAMNSVAGNGGAGNKAMQFQPGGGSSISSASLVLTFKFNVAASGSFVLNYDYQNSAKPGTSATMTWALALNGIQQGSLQIVTSGNDTSWDSPVGGVTFSSITANANDILSLTETFAGFANGDKLSFDNIQLSSSNLVPEPVNTALATFAGLAGLGLCVGALRKKFAKTAETVE